ncbi:hypothetical protein [Microvirga sp. G4-2]|uniref:hypothetical protein n=1 Tax=Microvirga sp. G4-2 TaxID=3434467 RepID=UPI004044DFF6
MARQAGYEIVLRLRLPVDQKDISDTIAKAKAVQKAEGGDIAGLLDSQEFEIKEFKQTFTSWNTGTGRAGEEETDEESASSQQQRGGRFGRTVAQRYEEVTLN